MTPGVSAWMLEDLGLPKFHKQQQMLLGFESM